MALQIVWTSNAQEHKSVRQAASETNSNYYGKNIILLDFKTSYFFLQMVWKLRESVEYLADSPIS